MAAGNLWIRHHITNKATPLLPFFLVLYSIAATAQANVPDTEQYLTELFSQPAETVSLPFNT